MITTKVFFLQNYYYCMETRDPEHHDPEHHGSLLSLLVTSILGARGDDLSNGSLLVRPDSRAPGREQ